MKPSDAIKETVSRFGFAVLPTKQFINLLDDIGAFKDEPTASKRVMKGLLDSGFGEMLYRFSEKKDRNWQNSVRKCVADYASKSGYKDEIINEVAAQLLFGVGLINELPKKEAQIQPKAHTSERRIKDPKELLYALKQDYLSALSNLLTFTTDEYGHKVGYYTTEANTQLYVIDSKIRLIAKELGESNIDVWLSSEKKKIEDKNRPTQIQIKQALDDLMSTLERDHKALMEDGYIVEDDEFGLKSARFPSNVTSDLRSIENKIIIIGNRRSENRQSWIDRTKSDFLASKSSVHSAYVDVLDKLELLYINRLNELDRNTRSGDIDYSDKILTDFAFKIRSLGQRLGEIETWCDDENEKIANRRNIRFAKRKKRNIIVSSVAGIALLIGGWQGISYTSSADARAAYEATMASANAEYANGNYATALNLFQKAENEYNASYSASSYKGDAHAKAIEASDKIISNWADKVKPLLQSKKVAQAKALTLALPTNLVLDGNSEQTFKSLSEQIDKDLATRTTELVDELLNDIYVHHGSLSESGKLELDEMIKVVPDNYWLNFIKEKTK